jgi:rhomboid protease GluP
LSIKLKESNVYKKNTSQSVETIEIIDGDRLSISEVEKMRISNKRKMESIEGEKRFHILQIFVFENKPDKKYINMVNSLQFGDTNSNSYIISLCIDVTQGKIYKNFVDDGEFTNILFSINGILEERLFESYNDYLKNENIEEVEFRVKYIVKQPLVTYYFVILNFIIYILAFAYSIYYKEEFYYVLIKFGAKVNDNIIQGEYWRLITSIFLHSDFRHLFFNLISLMFLGSIVERVFGHYKFFMFYIVAGFFGSVLSLGFTKNVSVGASGAIFGLLGVILIYGLSNKGFFKTALGANIILVLGFNLFYGLANQRIDNYAHLGGLIFGYLIAGIILKQDEKDNFYLNKDFCLFMFVTISIFLLLYIFI